MFCHSYCLCYFLDQALDWDHTLLSAGHTFSAQAQLLICQA